VLTFAVVAVLGWLGYLFVNSRRSRAARPEETPQNLQPYMSDEELENRRTTRVLRAALFSALLLAVVLPWYAIVEPDRQQAAAEEIHELDVHEGERWFTAFACIDCHGPAGVGGSTEFAEPRSGVSTNWFVPSLDDVLYRFTTEEIEQVIVFGRAGTPMVGAGLEGGGAMTEQEIEQVVAYIESIQISQAEALAKSEPAVTSALSRVENGAALTEALIAREEAKREEVLAAPEKLALVGDFPDRIKDLFTQDGTCTSASAAVEGAMCENPGTDTDRDGLTDAVEPELTEMARVARLTLRELNETTLELAEKVVYGFSFDPLLAFTNESATGTPIEDLHAAESVLTELENDVLLLTVTVDRQADFLEGIDAGIEFLETSGELQLWDPRPYAEVADAMNEQARHDRQWLLDNTELTESDLPLGSGFIAAPDAERAVGLFNAYCARCHTGGWSSGPSFEVGAGHGAWGPAIYQGRSVIQFPNWLDQVAFVINGSDDAANYGINGIGTGRMPGHGAVLTQSDIELIVRYERSL
jgi:mono/diheme cytochrome c family protein